MSVQLTVERSPIRQFLIGFAGVVLIVTALDILWWHVLSSAPTVGDDGGLTTRGIVERRQDILWSSLFVVVGVPLLFVGIVGLFRRAPVVELSDDALYLRIAGPSRGVRIPWSEVLSVRSGSEDDDGRVPGRQLLIEVADPAMYPPDPWAAEWDGSVLHVDADAWDVPAEEVAVHCNLGLARLVGSRREPGDPPEQQGGD